MPAPHGGLTTRPDPGPYSYWPHGPLIITPTRQCDSAPFSYGIHITVADARFRFTCQHSPVRMLRLGLMPMLRLGLMPMRRLTPTSTLIGPTNANANVNRAH